MSAVVLAQEVVGAAGTSHAAMGLQLTIAGAAVLCRPSGALWLASEGALVVADLHLEKGSAFAARGQLLPPYDTGETLARLSAEVAHLGPRLVILLGDSFHDPMGPSRLTAKDAVSIQELAAARRLVWILGNHDPDGPGEAPPGEVLRSLTLGGLTFVHEPTPGLRPGEIAGHLHPCVKVRASQASVRRRCFATDRSRMVLPAFGAFAGGLNLLDPAFHGLFAGPPLAAVLGAGCVHLVGRRSLRTD